MLKIAQYNTIVFDCDGVILNSNKVKTEAFYNAALPYGKAFADALVEHHINNGGVSRYKKFEYFLNVIVGCSVVDKVELDALLGSYAEFVWQGLLNCEIAEGLHELRAKTKEARWLVASGGDQIELRRLFKIRDIDSLFDAGVYGSPTSKESILAAAVGGGTIVPPALFIGDSKYDFKVATEFSLDFIFLSNWSEFKDWSDFFESSGAEIVIKNNLKELLSQND